jgi:hypothetical protein
MSKLTDKQLYDRELAARQEGIREVVGWLEQYAIHGGKTPLSLVLDDLKTHSLYGNPN